VERLVSDSEASRLLRRARLYASSLDTLRLLRGLGLEAGLALPQEPLDLYFDGLDEFSPEGCHVVKGRGAALAREKILAHNSSYVLLVADESKLAEKPGALGKPVPLEVLPPALDAVVAELSEKGIRAAPRTGCGCRDGPTVTDNCGVIVDAWPWGVMGPEEFAELVSSIPGVVEHGIFTGYADEVVIGHPSGEAGVYQCRRTRGRSTREAH
jgi:ribose 5-phosphate isomerase A